MCVHGWRVKLLCCTYRTNLNADTDSSWARSNACKPMIKDKTIVPPSEWARLEDIILDFPYIILFRISLYFHYCAPVDFYYACNYSHFFHNHGPEIFHNEKKKLHDTTKHKVGMLKLVRVYAHQRVLMVVVLLPLLIRVLRLSPSQVHNYTCCKLIPILQYGDESTLYYYHIFQHYFPHNSCSRISLLCRKLCSHNGRKPRVSLQSKDWCGPGL